MARELDEELGLAPAPGASRFLGAFTAIAANEPGCTLEAQLFHIRTAGSAFAIAAELEEAIWISIEDAAHLPLAPFTRNEVLPLARTLSRSCGARDIRE